MRKRAVRILLIVAAALAIAMLVAGCNAGKEGAAERIEVETTHIYLAPTGEASTYRLSPKVYPEETADQGVHYSLKDNSDRIYLLVDTDGTLTARGEVKQDEEGNVQDIIVVITSNQSSDVYIEITVTIEEVEVRQIIFPESVIVVELHSEGVQLQPQFKHPHGLSDIEFNSLFTKDKPIVLAFHGYPTIIHELLYHRENKNLFVCGYQEEGTITTPFDMRVQNEIDRYHLVADVINSLPQLGNKGAYLLQKMNDTLVEHKQYIGEYGEDIPEVRDWQWHLPESK